MASASSTRVGGSRARSRCAIYTRKSSEEGLEQAFNSLDAQRETCEAYVLSQKHEGWTVLPAMYDDGGISGGTMDRPALKRLLADIAGGAVDTVVVYKVDRLTRSLSDFAKIVEVFETNGVTFVSVTQSFNTTTSMGRLTLNMLLSFAQFEREVAGERIRDKIAASKRKGMWMGGLPPLGYDVADRKLVVNDSEAETVRHIFRRYTSLGSVRALREELAAAGIVSKRRIDRFGRETGGKPFSRGALYLMLQNPIYRGQIVHRQNSYAGQHEAIVDERLWSEVQARLQVNRVDRNTRARAVEPSLLVGLVHDETGERMTPTHANKKGTRYRYYVSQGLIQRGRWRGIETGRRVPAGELEHLVAHRIIDFLADGPAVLGALEPLLPDPCVRGVLAREAARLAAAWPEQSPSDRTSILRRLVERIDFSQNSVEIRIRPMAIEDLLNTARSTSSPIVDFIDATTIALSAPVNLRRAGKQNRLLIEAPGDVDRQPDRSLLRLLGQAHRFQEIALRGNGRPIAELAAEAGVVPSYFTRVLRLSFLAPSIVKLILEGSHPSQLTAKSLTEKSPELAHNWAKQSEQLGLN